MKENTAKSLMQRMGGSVRGSVMSESTEPNEATQMDQQRKREKRVLDEVKRFARVIVASETKIIKLLDKHGAEIQELAEASGISSNEIAKLLQQRYSKLPHAALQGIAAEAMAIFEEGELDLGNALGSDTFDLLAQLTGRSDSEMYGAWKPKKRRWNLTAVSGFDLM